MAAAGMAAMAKQKQYDRLKARKPADASDEQWQADLKLIEEARDNLKVWLAFVYDRGT